MQCHNRSTETSLSRTDSTTSHADEQQVLRVSQAYDTITLRQDAVAGARLLADDYIATQPEGISNKAQTLAWLRSGGVHFTAGHSDDVRVRVYGQTAVATGRWTGYGTYRGKPFRDNQRYTTVFVRRKDRWQIVAEHLSDIKL